MSDSEGKLVWGESSSTEVDLNDLVVVNSFTVGGQTDSAPEVEVVLIDNLETFDASRISLYNATQSHASNSKLFNGSIETGGGSNHIRNVNSALDWGVGYAFADAYSFSELKIQNRGDCCFKRAGGGVFKIYKGGVLVYTSPIIQTSNVGGEYSDAVYPNIKGDEVRYIFENGAKTQENGYVFNASEIVIIGGESTIGASFFVSNQGKVGVGTSNPTQSLSVEGSAQISGKFHDSSGAAGTEGQALLSDSEGKLVWGEASGEGSGGANLNEGNNYIDISDEDGGLVLSHGHVSSPTALSANFAKGSQAAVTGEAEVLESKIKLVGGSIHLITGNEELEGATMRIKKEGDFEMYLGENIAPSYGFVFRGKDKKRFVYFQGNNKSVGIGHMPLRDSFGLTSVLDVYGSTRTGTHPSNVPGMYVTGGFDSAKGIEFRHSNGTQGIGFGYNTIYATGSNENQNLNLKARGNGKVIINKLEINGQVASEEGYSIIGTDALKIGRDAGNEIDLNGKSHVFIGHDAGSKAGFDNIAVIDYEDDANTNPITGVQYLDNHSVFVLNNSNDLTKPLLFGNFAKDGVTNSMAQLAINTHHVVDSVALTVSGAVHIGPKGIDPTVFPSKEGYEDALLWVEKGIVTEDVTYAFTSSWKDWPDYVFEEDYDLMKLSELDKYIRKNKHLPNISSMEEVKENGLKSKGMIINLLKKIEELTLYTLNQEKKIENQQQLNQALLKRLIAIEEQLKN